MRTFYELDADGNASEIDMPSGLYGEPALGPDIEEQEATSAVMMAGPSTGGSSAGWYKCVCNQGTGGNCASAASTLCKDNVDSIRECFRTLYESCR